MRHQIDLAARRSYWRHILLHCLLIVAAGQMAAAQAAGMTSITVDGKEWTGIRRVEARPDGKIMIITEAGGGMVRLDKLTPEFLASWGINSEQAKQDDFERALVAEKFRLVDGVVYDLRAEQPKWATFKRARVVGRIGRGSALLDLNPDGRTYNLVHVKNLAIVNKVGDADRFEFTAMLMGTFELTGPDNRTITVRSYDAGVPCDRTQIPDAILKEGKTSAQVGGGSKEASPMEALPERDSIVGSGTAFFVNEHGYLITNDHVVRGARKIRIRINRKTVDAECVKSDQAKDLALLKVNERWQETHLSLVASGDPKLGDEVFTIGFPNTTIQGLQPKFTDGKISSLSGLRDDSGTYQISVPVQPGNSGGPLVRNDGQVVGVIVGSLNSMATLARMGTLPQNVNYAIKIKTVRDFIASANLPSSDSTKSTKELTREEAVKLVESSVCQVICYK